MLYPFKFKTQYKDKIWGGNKLEKLLNKRIPSDFCGESWEISAVENNISVVSNGILAGNDIQELIEVYMGDLVGDAVYERFGLEFPLLFKFIDAQDTLSIQVHPNDEIAKKLHKAYGKTEMWYIVDAEPNANLFTGFKKTVSKDNFLKTILSQNEEEILDLLNVEHPQTGDVYEIPAGRIHGIGKGIVLAEIQQTSDITYRVFDWNRKDSMGNYRELHLDYATEALDFTIQKQYKTNYGSIVNKSSKLVDNKYFTTDVLTFDTVIEKDYMSLDSFVVYMCVDGNFEIASEEFDNEVITKGETVLIPALLKNITLKPKQKSTILEVYIT